MTNQAHYIIISILYIAMLFLNLIQCLFSLTTGIRLNVAYRKNATQSPGDLSKEYGANLAVDGNNSVEFDDHSCTHTASSFSKKVFWRVDLKKAYKISGIVIYNRKGIEKRLKNFIIYGNITEVLHNSNGSDEYSQSVIHIPLEDERLFSTISVVLPANSGYSTNGKHYLILCEVEIFTATCEYINITNGAMKPSEKLYEINTQVLIECNEGFEPTMQYITCGNNKNWTHHKACSRVFCIYPEKPLNGDYIVGYVQNHATYLPSSLPYGSVITVRCDLGYRNENNENRTCQQDGTWNEAPVCKKVQCYYPKSIANGKYHFQNGSSYQSGLSYYNTTVQVLCDTGYRIVGRKGRTCNASETWSGETTKGYSINSTSNVRRCLETGLWSGEHINCVFVTCRQPEELKDGFYNYTKELFSERAPYNTIVTAVCDVYFELVNPENRKRRCTEAGVWDKEPALCDMLCDVPNVTNGQFLNLMTSKVKIGTSLYFTCNPGFTPATSNNDITCLKSQHWSETPECKATQKTSTAALLGGTSGAVVLLVIMISGLVFYLVRRRKRNSKHHEESMTYTDLQKKQNRPSEDDYAAINAMELEKSGSSKDEKHTGIYNEVYYHSTIEM